MQDLQHDWVANHFKNTSRSRDPDLHCSYDPYQHKNVSWNDQRVLLSELKPVSRRY